jgi:hypothetical protein
MVKSGSLGELATANRQQQRLYDQRVNRYGANEPPPEARSRIRLISPGSHARELMLVSADLVALGSIRLSAGEPDRLDLDDVEPKVTIVGTIGLATPIARCGLESKYPIGKE